MMFLSGIATSCSIILVSKVIHQRSGPGWISGVLIRGLYHLFVLMVGSSRDMAASLSTCVKEGIQAWMLRNRWGSSRCIWVGCRTLFDKLNSLLQVILKAIPKLHFAIFWQLVEEPEGVSHASCKLEHLQLDIVLRVDSDLSTSSQRHVVIWWDVCIEVERRCWPDQTAFKSVDWFSMSTW